VEATLQETIFPLVPQCKPTRRQMSVAVAEEDFGSAARLRDEVAALRGQLSPVQQFLFAQLEVLAAPGSSDEARRAAVAALGQAGDDSVLPDLAALLAAKGDGALQARHVLGALCPRCRVAAANDAAAAPGAMPSLQQLAQRFARPLMKELYTLCMSLYSPAFPITPVVCLLMSPDNTWVVFNPAAFNVLAHVHAFINQFMMLNPGAPVQDAAIAFMMQQLQLGAVGDAAAEVDDDDEVDDGGDDEVDEVDDGR